MIAFLMQVGSPIMFLDNLDFSALSRILFVLIYILVIFFLHSLLYFLLSLLSAELLGLFFFLQRFGLLIFLFGRLLEFNQTLIWTVDVRLIDVFCWIGALGDGFVIVFFVRVIVDYSTFLILIIRFDSVFSLNVAVSSILLITKKSEW